MIFVNYITCKKHHMHFLYVVRLKRPPFFTLNWYLVIRFNLKYLCFRVRCERSIHNWKWHFIQDNKTMYIFLSNFWYTLFIRTCRMKLECMDMIGLEFYRKKGGIEQQIEDLSIRSFFTLNNTLNCEMNLYMHCTPRHNYLK